MGSTPLRLLIIVTAMATLFVQPANAATCGTGLNPILVVPTPVVFAVYDALLGTDTTINGDVTVSCTVIVVDTLPSFTVALSTGGGGGFNPRKLTFLSNTLDYNLYTSSSYTTIWGDGTGGTATQTYSSSSGLAVKSFTVFGRVPKNQYVPIGTYLDSITVTVTY